ncbi:MAG: sodium:proton antiporter [Thermoleophilia bacterium]|nr:sodium:proton antiporter [Thermoleophilia bacterium]MDH3724754.1 sodium:proton antiporter [Thermoleophilia bacterium]
MHPDILSELAIILVLAVGAQIVAARLRVPSILLLLLVGFGAAQLALIDPGAIDSDILLPLVSLAVGLILFEGGLTLDLRDLREDAPNVVTRLLTVGVLATWLIGAVAGHYVLDLRWSLSFLLGAVLVVTGPTVVLPLLKHMHLGGRVESILRWEGIVVDPIGALLAVLVFQAVRAGQRPTIFEGLGDFLVNTGIGAVVGVVAAGVLILLIRRASLGDNQEIAATLALVVAAVAAADWLANESGLVAATLMGIVIANVQGSEVRHIRVFKENVGLLLTGVLFIVLAGRVEWDDIESVGVEAILFVVVLVLVARPLATVVSTWGSSLEWRERALIGWMAPRGIVAAATASIFAVELAEGEDPIAGAEILAPVTFVVIVGTVALYGLTAGWLAQALGLLHKGPTRVLIAGAHGWGRSIAAELRRHDIPVKMWATRPENEQLARQAKLDVRGGDLLQDRPVEGEEADLAVLMTDNSEFNGLAALHLREYVHPDKIFQLGSKTAGSQRATVAFDPAMTFDRLDGWFSSGATIKSQQVGGDEYAAGPDDVPLFVVQPGRAVRVVTKRGEVDAKPGQVVIALERAVTSAAPEAETVPTAEEGK